MKTATFSVVAMASVAAAIPMCAPDMYHCFCKIPSLQQHFLDCAYTGNQCANEAEGAEAVAFGVDLCSPPIVVGAANAKAVSGLLAAAGLVAALI
ncbi:unnamed protein product [Parascedosporium putredinis]|uniref:Extracellular membrane protein CFEM domain-containing protein n=1 Tax=Parascedosporium putredinis TaxID=1442378 RepID=A0A9P1GXD2_9PEZI|nr:unnamed protein product [Parascedosporium putredinis]CAI7988920.1 unnamed protein product [Parascedosporium putredinis]